MESEKSDPAGTVILFASAAEADRRVAGVPAAARIAHDVAAGVPARIWLAFRGGGDLAPATETELDRLVPGARVETVALESLDHLLSEAEPGRLTVFPAPLLDEAAILRATGKESDGPIAKWLNRPMSQRLSRLLLRIPGFLPLHATLGTVAIATMMFLALILGGTTGFIAGALLFHAASVFDGVDGEVARATFRSSNTGASLDSAVDVATNILFFVGCTINLALAGNANAALLGLWGLGAFTLGLIEIGRRTLAADQPLGFDLLKHHYEGRFAGRLASLIVLVLTKISGRDFFALMFAILVFVAPPIAVLQMFAGGASMWFLIVVASSVPLSRQRSA